jgi:hypothetical protein
MSEQMIILQSQNYSWGLSESPDESLAFLFPTNPTPGAHRYWRLYISANYSQNSVYTSFAEVELRAVMGGPDMTVPGGAVSASAQNSSNGQGVANSTDDSASTVYSSYSGTLPNVWWQYDFGAGNARQIVEVAITARNDSYWAEAPSTFFLQYSDDGAAWNTAWAIRGAAWQQGQTQAVNYLMAYPLWGQRTAMFIGAGREEWAAAPWNVATIREQTPTPAGTGGNACF